MQNVFKPQDHVARAVESRNDSTQFSTLNDLDPLETPAMPETAEPTPPSDPSTVRNAGVGDQDAADNGNRDGDAVTVTTFSGGMGNNGKASEAEILVILAKNSSQFPYSRKHHLHQQSYP